MSKKEDQELARLARLRRLQELRKNYSLFFWTPYEKQREFHRAGKTYRERLLMAGNQLGKTICAGNEVAMHVTGLYPDWWDGKVFERETRGWVAGLTAELTRDGAQRVLLGPIGQWGSGCIPKEHILEIKRSRGVPDAVETILIKHVNGGVSQITFKASADGREAFQSETLDWLWFDEEPPITIYTEAITRTAVAMGPVFLTFTPLLGRSSVVVRFLDEPSRDRHVTKMTIEDVGHFQGEAKRIHIESYPEHERDARLRGLPMFGVGRVYAIAEEAITEKPLVYVPSNWKQIIGLDIGGFDHPTAFVLLAWDVDADCVHVLKCYRRAKEMPLVHTAAVKPWGEWVPVAWPRDGLQHDKGGSCEQIKKQYADHGLKMLSEWAQFPDKRGFGVQAGIDMILERMRTGRFKVDANLSEWWEEFRNYHRKPKQDGTSEIHKQGDDLMDATRYAMMMLRYALPEEYAPKPRDKYANHRASTGGPSWMSS